MIQSSQINRYTNFINLLRLNFKLLTKSISFYVILGILFVGSILINFLIYRNGGSFRVALSTLTPEFLLSICLSITLFNLLSSQYRDGFYRNKIITGNDRSSIYFADLTLAAIISILFALVIIIIQPIMYSIVSISGNPSLGGESVLWKAGKLLSLYNSTFPLYVLTDIFTALTVCSFVTMIVSVLNISIKWVQTIIYTSIIFLSLISCFCSLMDIVPDLDFRKEIVYSNNTCFFIPFSLPFGSSNVANLYHYFLSIEWSNGVGVKSNILVNFNSAWYCCIVQIAYSILFMVIGVTSYNKKNFK